MQDWKEELLARTGDLYPECPYTVDALSSPMTRDNMGYWCWRVASPYELEKHVEYKLDNNDLYKYYLEKTITDVSTVIQ